MQTAGPPVASSRNTPPDDQAEIDAALDDIIRRLARRRAWEDHLREMGAGGHPQ